MPHPDYPQVLAQLESALRDAPDAQLALLSATDATYAFIDEHESGLSDDELLSLRMLLGHAETLLTRYFGM